MDVSWIMDDDSFNYDRVVMVVTSGISPPARRRALSTYPKTRKREDRSRFICLKAGIHYFVGRWPAAQSAGQAGPRQWGHLTCTLIRKKEIMSLFGNLVC